ncbi:MAG: 5'-nucleotidase C-terminal domain-containing protein [Gemmatimonadota bacterium]|nr:5'-nucleotidase C-terminal domain-containing protein [Gemmatimonadota bacterium]
MPRRKIRGVTPAAMLSALVVSATLPGAGPLGAQSRVELKVAATTDVHGRLRGWDYFLNAPDPARGLARAATVVDSLRRAAPGRVVLVDAGDLLQGNAMTFVAARIDSLAPSPVIAAMNRMRYDAAAAGNHEFNYGLDLFDRARRGARFPFLATNTRRLDGGAPFPAQVTVERAGVKVAIIGATNPGAAVWDRDHLAGRLEITDIVAALPAQVRAARAAGAGLVVVVGHAGLGEESSYDTLATGRASENPMARVAREVPGIDLIVYGHSHREVADTVINGVLLVQPRNWATSVAVATLVMRRAEPADGPGPPWRVERKSSVVVPVAGRAESRAVVSAVARAHAAATRYALTVIGRTDTLWRTDSARLRDVPLIDFIQEVQRQATGADLSVASAFALDVVLPPGPVTVAQIAQLYPYDNTLRAVRLSGAQVRAFLEHSARYYVVRFDSAGPPTFAPDRRIPGYNYDVLAGADYVIDLARPIGRRITSLTIKGRPIADTDSFTVAINNYRANGGGGYDMLRGARVVYESPTEVRELMVDEVRKRGVLRPADYFVENWQLLPPHRSLRVLAVNDFHGALVKRPEGNAGNRGGAAEMATALHGAARECAPGCVAILLHGGDLFQGTPASNLAYGRPVVELLNTLGFAAGALGNHEFDWGQDTLRARMAGLHSPILGANVTYADGSDVPWIPDDTVITVGGVRVGVVGIADPATPHTTMPKNVWDLRFAPPVPVVTARARALRARGAQVVVLVAHLGGFCDRSDPDQCEGAIFDLANATGPGVLDAIVSGHTHSEIRTVANGIPIVQARASGRAIGVIDLPFDGPRLPAARPEVRPVVSDSVTPEAAIAAVVRRATDAVAPLVSAVVVQLGAPLPRDGDQYALGNLIADAHRVAGKGDVAVTNNGGIRTGLRAGPVTWGDLYEVQPFANRLVVMTVRGDALRTYFEGLVGGSGVRYHVSGVRLEFDAAGARGARLRRVTMADGSRLDDRRRYRVVMSDFLAAGGDGVSLAEDATREELNLVDLDALVDYLRASARGRLEVTAALKAPRLVKVP